MLYAWRMPTKMVQIRDVDSEVVDVLKSRAAAAGLSLSEFLKRQLEEDARRPTNEELFEEWNRRPRRNLDISGADLVREHRDEYE